MHDKVLRGKVERLRAAFIFCGDIIRAPDGIYQGWRSLSGSEGDKTGPMPSLVRQQAGAALSRMNEQLMLVVSGGETNVPDGGPAPTIAEVARAELMQMGVDPRRIVIENKAFSTVEQIEQCARIAREHTWGADEIAVVTLHFHFGRITAMMQHLDPAFIAPFDVRQTAFLSVERVLAALDPAWNTHFMELYARPEFAVTIISEALGTGQLWAGHQPRYPKPFRGFQDPLVE